MSIKIRCIGGITIDRKLTSNHRFQLGTSNPVSSVSTFGGVAHNVAKNLALLTDNIHMQSVVGHDNEGTNALIYLKNLGIETKDVLIINNKPTARYDVLLDNEGELFLALADMEIFDHLPFHHFTQSWHEWDKEDIIFLDTNLPQAILDHAMQIASIKNIKLCIDSVSVIKAKKLSTCLKQVFMLKPDRLEAEALTNVSINTISDCIKAGKILHDKGVRNCIISLGKSGYVIVNEEIQEHFPAMHVDSIVDVSGVGDAFIAGTLYELKQNKPITEACRMGAAMAALTLQSRHTVNEQINLSTLKNTLLKFTKRETNHEAIF